MANARQRLNSSHGKPSTNFGFYRKDHAIVRDDLRSLLTSEPNIEIVSETDNDRDAIGQITSLNLDLVLMDLFMPGMNEIDTTRDIRSRNSTIRIIVFTAHRTEEYIVDVLTI